MRSDFMRPDFMQASRAYPDQLLATGVCLPARGTETQLHLLLPKLFF
jgi:hypothetical protein